MSKRLFLASALFGAGWPLAAGTAIADDATYVTAPVIITSTTPISEIYGTVLPNSSSYVFDATEPSGAPALETGELLRSVPGVNASRAGGHGFEPFIRGQQQNQLTVIDNGAQVYGACPGRMDPPTSLARPGGYDTMTVIRGYQTVTAGPGATGGAIILDKQRPDMDQLFSGSVWAGGESNGDGTSTGLSATIARDGYYVSADGSWLRSNSYESGDGGKVRSGFDQVGGSLTVGFEAESGSFLEAAASRDLVTDALYNGMMDSPETKTVGGRAKGKIAVNGDVVSSIDFSVYGNRVDHVMDNHSLRDVSGMYMTTLADSETYGARIAAGMDIMDTRTVVGFDTRTNNRLAMGYMGMTPSLANVRTYSWPDITIAEVGLFGESTIDLEEDTRLVAGLRTNFVYTSEGAADLIPKTAVSGQFRSANSLYRDYYGVTYDDRTEFNVGGLLRVENDLTDTVTLNLGVSRAVRTADATERGIASGFGANAHVGNPTLSPEKHHQLDAGIAWDDAAGSTAFFSPYVNWVDDYILVDRARGEYGLLRSDGAKIYHNTTALLAGFESGASYRLDDSWIVTGDLAFTYGQDLESHRALAQIPPLTGSLGLTYEADWWSLGGDVRGAATQTRVDTDTATGTGQDIGETSGWMTLNLHGTVKAFDAVDVGFGVTNLLDATYANHLNKTATFEPDDYQVYEPGRSVYLRATARF